jgi:hypothetical protein
MDATQKMAGRCGAHRGRGGARRGPRSSGGGAPAPPSSERGKPGTRSEELRVRPCTGDPASTTSHFGIPGCLISVAMYSCRSDALALVLVS